MTKINVKPPFEPSLGRLMITKVTLDIQLFFTLEDSVKGPHLKINSSKKIEFALSIMKFLCWNCWGLSLEPRLQKDSAVLYIPWVSLAFSLPAQYLAFWLFREVISLNKDIATNIRTAWSPCCANRNENHLPTILKTSSLHLLKLQFTFISYFTKIGIAQCSTFHILSSLS